MQQSGRSCTNCDNGRGCKNPATYQPPPRCAAPLTPPPTQTHTLRGSNRTNHSLIRQKKINLPPASAKSEWNEVNSFFEATLRNTFPRQLINTLSSTDIAQNLDDFVSWTLLDRCSQTLVELQKSPQTSSSENRAPLQKGLVRSDA